MTTNQLGIYMGAYSIGYLSASHWNLEVLPKLFFTLCIFVVFNAMIHLGKVVLKNYDIKF